MSDFLNRMKSAAKADLKTIVLPEGEDPRTIVAATKIIEEGLAKIVILGNPDEIDVPGATVINPRTAERKEDYAAKFAELLGEVVTDSTKKNLEMRVEAENGATAGKTDLAKRAKAAGLDAIHDTVHEMARDEARHGKAFAGLLKRYFG